MKSIKQKLTLKQIEHKYDFAKMWVETFLILMFTTLIAGWTVNNELAKFFFYIFASIFGLGLIYVFYYFFRLYNRLLKLYGDKK